MDNDHKPLDPRELVVSNAIRERRFNICKNCEKINSLNFCKICKCFMPAKTWLAISDCPLKKWPKDN